MTDEPMRQIIRAPKVRELTGLGSDTTLWRRSRNQDSDFPIPVELGQGLKGWYLDEVLAWIESRPRVSYATLQPDQQESAAA